MPRNHQHMLGAVPHESSPALVRRARAGDRNAFAQLWRRHASTVHAVVLSVLPASQAEDLMQDVAAAALRSLSGLRDDHGFVAWLCAIARNRARNARSALRRTMPLVDPDALPAAASHDELEADEILAVIRSLPETYRESLLMRLVAGMSGPEIAERLRMTPGSVRVNLCRGIKLLRARLGGAQIHGE